MDIYIKNMVCNRCITAVSEIFHQAGVRPAKVILGQVTVNGLIPLDKMDAIENRLHEEGFEIIRSEQSQLVKRIKKAVFNFVFDSPEENNENFSDYLSRLIHKDYNSLSSLFSSVEGLTIEKYLINLKIERVRGLLVEDKKTLSEITFEMGYSSLAHLSGQFKKVTGYTPTYFKSLKDKNGNE